MDIRKAIQIIEGAIREYPGANHFTDWSDFGNKLNSAISKGLTDYQSVCEAVGIDYAYFQKVIEYAVISWRDSTTTSILNGIAHMSGMPTPGSLIFPDLIWQTRFLLKATTLGIGGTAMVLNPDYKSGGDRYIKVISEPAKTARDEERLNQLLQVIYLYYHVNQNKNVKLPKILYRGFRAHDLFNHPTLKPIIKAVVEDGEKFHFRHKKLVDTVIDYIIENGLKDITKQHLFSFTASVPVAKYFASGKGFILKVDPKRVDVISSEMHDPDNLKGGTYETRGRDEREYIVRFPDDYKFSRDDIIISSLDYLIAENSPLAVAYFDHNNKEAQYEMNGVKLAAKFMWKTNSSGSIQFKVNDGWWQSRKYVKEEIGFDPLPTEANLDQISNFKIIDVKSW